MFLLYFLKFYLFRLIYIYIKPFIVRDWFKVRVRVGDGLGSGSQVEAADNLWIQNKKLYTLQSPNSKEK